MFEALEQCSTAALGVASMIRCHCHKHDLLTRQQPADTMEQQGAEGSVLLQGMLCVLAEPGFGHARIVLELQGLEGGSIKTLSPDSANENSHCSLTLLPLFKLTPGGEAFSANLDQRCWLSHR